MLGREASPAPAQTRLERRLACGYQVGDAPARWLRSVGSAQGEGVSSASLAQRVFRTVGESSASERVAAAHPMLTDVTLGCWLSASILDLAGGAGSRGSAKLLLGIGLLAATILFLSSLVARVRGRYSAGSRFALAGNLVMAGAGFLGGHLALNRGTASRA